MSDVSQTKILVVVDDALLRKSVSRFIGQKGYEVFESENGYEALKIFKKEKPALVLTDIRMPVMDGLDLLDELTEESPQTPVIIFSDTSSDSEIQEALAMGAWDYIAKPIKKVEFLLEKIEKVLVQAQKEYGKTQNLDEETILVRNSRYEQELKKRKKLEKQIAHAKLEWERTLDALTEPIALMDTNHFLTRVNQSMAQIFSTLPREIVGTKKFLSTQGFDNPEQA